MSQAYQIDTVLTVTVKGDFNAGWLWACLGMSLPPDANLYFREGYETALETPSLQSMRSIMEDFHQRGHAAVSKDH